MFLTITSAVLAVNIDRKRYRSAATQQNLDRTLSQRHRAHLSINDVDITNLPRPTRSLRHGLQQSCRDSRFYSIMPSEEEIKTFPDGTAESLAQTPYLVEEPGANPSHMANRSHRHRQISVARLLGRSFGRGMRWQLYRIWRSSSSRICRFCHS